MTRQKSNDEEIEMLNRRIKGWQQSFVDECKSSDRKCRKLRREIRKLNARIAANVASALARAALGKRG